MANMPGWLKTSPKVLNPREARVMMPCGLVW